MPPNPRQMVEGLIGFGNVFTSAVSTLLKNVLLHVRMDEDDDGTFEQFENSEGFEHAAILHRPADPTPSTADPSVLEDMEVLVLRRGDELIVIGSLDKRNQIDLAKGEVVLRAYGLLAGRIHVLPTGGIIIGPSDATLEKIALGETLQTFVDVFFNSWTVVPNDGGAALQAALNVAFPSGSPTVTSAKHKVET